VKKVQLTAIARHKLKDIEQSLIPHLPDGETNRGFQGSSVRVWLEDNPYASLRRGEHLALRVDACGVCVGYIPELSTLDGYIKEAEEKGDTYTIEKNTKRKADAGAIREQLFSEYDNDYTKQEWFAHVCELLYAKQGQTGFIGYQEYSELCQAGKADGWHLVYVSIEFDYD